MNESVTARLSAFILASILTLLFECGAEPRSGPAIGRICEISACGLSAVLARNLECGEGVELQFVLNGLEIRVWAAVRNRNDKRYGFEFLTLSANQRQHIQAATRILAAAPEEN